MLNRIIEKILLTKKIPNFFKDLFSRKKVFSKFPPYDIALHNYLITTLDPIRYLTIAFAINTIKNENIDGSFAEVGVYKGYTSKIIHDLAPLRKLYLFDTFQGFINKDDLRFQDVNIEIVKRNIKNLNNIIFKKDFFPKTAIGLENEIFAFVMIDLDKYKPTLDALKFFLPRVNSGGYIFLHDYSSPESNWAVSKATNEFLDGKPEKVIQIPDRLGSVVIRKI